MEILRQHQHAIHAIFVAIGGGGLISGVAAYVRAVRPEIKIVGVQMTDSDAMVRSVRAGRRVEIHDVGLFADGTAVKLVGEETFRLTSALVDDFVVVDTDAAGKREEMQDGIGRTTDRTIDADGILEGFLGQDIGRLQILLDHVDDTTA